MSSHRSRNDTTSYMFISYHIYQTVRYKNVKTDQFYCLSHYLVAVNFQTRTMTSKQEAKTKSENFIYVGLMSNTHLFIHVVINDISEKLIEEMCGECYNVMISETMILKDQSLVVFNIIKDKIKVVSVTHHTFPLLEFSEGALRKSLIKALKADRSKDKDMMTISVEFCEEKVSMKKLFIIPMSAMQSVLDSFKDLAEVSDTLPKDIKVDQMICIKKIDYLDDK